MGRRRKAWLYGGKTGVRVQDGQRLKGFYAGYRDYTTGTAVRRSRHFLTKDAAAEWVRQYNARSDLGAIGAIVPTSLRDASVEFLAGCSALATDTRKQYVSVLGYLQVQVGADALV